MLRCFAQDCLTFSGGSALRFRCPEYLSVVVRVARTTASSLTIRGRLSVWRPRILLRPHLVAPASTGGPAPVYLKQSGMTQTMTITTWAGRHVFRRIG